MRELYQVVEVGPAWYQENIPCQEACPVKTNCRGYLNLAAAGEFEKGWELALDPLREEVPLRLDAPERHGRWTGVHPAARAGLRPAARQGRGGGSRLRRPL